MNRVSILMIGVILLNTAWCIAVVTTSGHEFDRYRVILDRRPFGEIIPAEPASATSAPTESLTKELVMRAIIDDDNGLRVGFLDKKSKKMFYLGVGEKNEGYELISVHYDNEEAVLRKGTETTIFTLKPNKPPVGPAGPGLATARPLMPSPTLGTLGAAATRGFTPMPRSGAKKPFFSNLKKRKFSPFKPLGTNAPIPFRTQSMESFMQAHSNAARGFSAPILPFKPVNRTDGQGDTIEGFLRANPDAARRFSPLKPPDRNVTTEGRGSTIEGFLMPNQDQAQPEESGE